MIKEVGGQSKGLIRIGMTLLATNEFAGLIVFWACLQTDGAVKYVLYVQRKSSSNPITRHSLSGMEICVPSNVNIGS